MADLPVGSGEIVTPTIPVAATSSSATTLAKSEDLEVLRLTLPAGAEFPTHRSPGALTVQCLTGNVAFTAHGRTQELAAGQLLLLAAGEPHAVRAMNDSILLLTRIRRLVPPR